MFSFFKKFNKFIEEGEYRWNDSNCNSRLVSFSKRKAELNKDQSSLKGQLALLKKQIEEIDFKNILETINNVLGEK